jgi:hypothetical protein
MIWSFLTLGVVGGVSVIAVSYWYTRMRKEEAKAYPEKARAAEHPDESRAASEGAESGEPVSKNTEGHATAEAKPASENAAAMTAELPEAGDTVAEEVTAVSGDAKEIGTAPPETDAKDRVAAALTSGELAAMEAVLQETSDPLLQDALLARIVAKHYRLRTEPEHRSAFYRFANQHIGAASNFLEAHEEAGKRRPDQIEAFKMIAIAMDEDARYEEAVEICKKALTLGLQDGTKTGFDGRIARLEKKLHST